MMQTTINIRRVLVCVALAALSLTAMRATPIDGLLERIDKGASRKFKIELHRGADDYFRLSQRGNRVCVEGNTWVNIATGINWYLKYYAGIHLSWNQMQAHLPAHLPRVERPERHDTQLRLRYDFNYCTYSYSMAFWDWSRWQREIDWMALHGINMPLAIVGTEVAWRNVLLRLGYSREEIGRFIAGPAFLAWWHMNNLEGWGGPLPETWYTKQEALQRNILHRMRELDMHPVFPGYAGMLPHDAPAKLGVDAVAGGTWNGYQRPATLSASDKRFDEIADMYYRELTRLYGRADYYSMDPFHESGNNARVDYAGTGRRLLAAMKRANPKATWVIQGWTENPRPQMIDALPAGDLLILDLFSECRPMWGIPSIWQRKQGYGKHEWLFCMLENFGANVGLHGRMDQLLHNFYLTKDNPLAARLRGIGFTMEGSENNPIMFELMSELPWRPDPIDRDTWVRGYVRARYGKDNDDVQTAWSLLARSIYNCPAGNNQQGPHESVFDARPGLDVFQVKSWSKMKNYYDPHATLVAARLMVGAADRFAGNNNFEYDLVDITRQALDDQARIQYQRVIADYKTFSREAFKRDSRRFLSMILLQDRLLGTRSEFRLGRWTEAARALGTTPDEKRLYEWNARVQITTWGNRRCADRGGLRDYAHKEWQGLLRDFYYMRWKTYFQAMEQQLAAGSEANYAVLGGSTGSANTSAELSTARTAPSLTIDWYALEEPWTLATNTYSAQPEGEPIEVARDVIRFLSSD